MHSKVKHAVCDRYISSIACPSSLLVEKSQKHRPEEACCSTPGPQSAHTEFEFIL